MTDDERAKLIELANRCKARAHGLANEAELCRLELEALLSVADRENANYDQTRDAGRWRYWSERTSEHKRSFKLTQDDVLHYLDCEQALRAKACQ